MCNPILVSSVTKLVQNYLRFAQPSFYDLKPLGPKKKATIEFLFDNGADPSALTDGSPIWSHCSRGEPALTMLLIDLWMNLTRWGRRKVNNDLVLDREELVGGRWSSLQTANELHQEDDLRKSLTQPSLWSLNANDEEFIPVVDLLLVKRFPNIPNFPNIHEMLHDWCSTRPILGLAGRRLYGSNSTRVDDVLKSLFLEREEIGPLERIAALELAGAMSLLHHKEEDISVSKAFLYWTAALDLRAQGSIPKVPLGDNSIVPWRAVEWTTEDHLEELVHRPLADMQIQALLVARRIDSRMIPDAPSLCWYVWDQFVKDYSSKLYSENRLTELLEICWCMLEGVRITHQKMIIDIVYDLVLCLRKLKDEKSPILNSETLHLSLKLVSDANRFHLGYNIDRNSGPVTVVSYFRDAAGFGMLTVRPMETIYKLFIILSDSPEMVTKEIKSCLHQFFKRDERDQ